MKCFLTPLIWACLCLSPQTHAATWLPISDEERSYTQSEVDPNAGAEVLYKSILLDDDEPTNSYREYYMRVKIYDERGAKSLGSYRLHYNSASSKMGTPSARIVKPDGRVIEVQKSEFYNQNLRNDSQGSMRSRVFSFPDLEAGDIVDLKYRINLNEYYYSPELFVTFQEPWPLRKASVKVRPATWVEGFTFIKWMTSKCDSRGMERKADGFFELNVENFPANVDEPNRPPEKQNMAWLMFYMAPNGKTGDDYWKAEGARLFRGMAGMTKPGNAVKNALKEALQGASSEEEKLRGIYRYCVSEIVNSAYGEEGRLSPEDRKDIKGDMSAERILAQGFGNPRNVNTVFCAMAQAAGFDARLAALNSRTGYQFSKSLVSIDTTMKNRCIAVKMGDDWNYFDPGGRYLPFGELDWNEQGIAAVIADKKKLELHVVPFSQAESSVEKSSANLELSEKGTLWGTVEFEYSGHFEVALKRALDGRSEQERREYMKDRFSKRWPRGSISAIEIENAASPLELTQSKGEYPDRFLC